uniref:Uncharacterized protein n=1 Tax=Candidozyma auris TaxID=498019 RepID=A0A0L0NPX3_CANAR
MKAFLKYFLQFKLPQILQKHIALKQQLVEQLQGSQPRLAFN